MRIKDFLKSIFSEDGNLSSMRIGTIGFMLFVMPVVFGVWLYLSISKGEMLPLPESIVVLYGIALSGKIGQKYVESKGKETNE